MKKILKLTTILLLVAGSLVSCEEENNVSASLTNTKWKLTGIVDVETGVLTELEPKDCNECYTIVFDTDSTFSGRTVNNIVFGNYNASTNHIVGMVISEALDTPEGELYGNILFKVNSFTVESTYPRELHLWYNDGKNYLKYKETGGSNEN